MKIFLLLALFPFYVQAAKVGEKAPSFTATDSNGKTHSLADYKGKFVVLEWHNKDCPFVKKHYDSKNMQGLQKDYTAKGVVWLTVISSKKNSQGYLTNDEANKYFQEQEMASNAFLIDEKGVIGKAYGAKVTPHMYVINPEGTLLYAGAIDDNSSSDASVIATSKNYVKAALDESMAGKKVSVATSKAYGCGVKY